MRRFLALALALTALPSCMPIRYVTQAAVGQERINQSGVPVEEIVQGNHLDAHTRGLLAHVSRIKAFGKTQGLVTTRNYERYVDLRRPAVVWVVSACDPLRFRPRTWSFPIVGSITYSGWFDRAEARTYAAGLAKQGWDVDVRPSQAYSTLGWFDDPILSTMITDGPSALGELADVVLHETLHATFYVPGQSTLNESVASFVGDTLAMRYLDETLGPDSAAKQEMIASREKGEARGRVMKSAYEELAALYASRLPKPQKLALKSQITGALRAKLEMKRPVTNATLIQYKTYGSGKEEMAALWKSCGESMPRMLGALERAKPSFAKARPHSDPGMLLKPLLATDCR